MDLNNLCTVGTEMFLDGRRAFYFIRIGQLDPEISLFPKSKKSGKCEGPTREHCSLNTTVINVPDPFPLIVEILLSYR